MSRKGPALMALHPVPECLPTFRKRRSSEQLPESPGQALRVFWRWLGSERGKAGWVLLSGRRQGDVLS